MVAPAFAHLPVMLSDVTELLGVVGPGVVVDGTLGAGGHARALLEARPDIEVHGVDRDPDARRAAAEALAPFGQRVTVTGGTADVGIRAAAARGPVVGVLMDLGVSSPQIDRPERGFSYRNDGVLDMRMDPDGPSPTAADLLADMDVATLSRLLRRLGDEPHAGRIARSILTGHPPRTTDELADRVRAAVPAAMRRRGDPAKRTFQALRIAVNDELDLLDAALDAALDVLVPGGRLVVIAYHSGEDRRVKDRLRREADPARDLPRHLPPPEALTPRLRLLTRRPRRPGEDEIRRNARATSARLRAAQTLEVRS